MKAVVEGRIFPFTVPQGFRITPEQFEQLASVEQSARLKFTASGELIVMSPQSVCSDCRQTTRGGTTERKNSRSTQKLSNWADNNDQGEVFDFSTVFVLPSGARKSTDVSWVKRELWNKNKSDRN